MVSGLVTSPWDQLRIFSGEASEMRMASKSVMGLVSSNGLERYKTTLLGTWLQIGTPKGAGYDPGTVYSPPVLPGVRTGLISNSGRGPGENTQDIVLGSFQPSLRDLS